MYIVGQKVAYVCVVVIKRWGDDVVKKKNIYILSQEMNLSSGTIFSYDTKDLIKGTMYVFCVSNQYTFQITHNDDMAPLSTSERVCVKSHSPLHFPHCETSIQCNETRKWSRIPHATRLLWRHAMVACCYGVWTRGMNTPPQIPSLSDIEFWGAERVGHVKIKRKRKLWRKICWFYCC